MEDDDGPKRAYNRAPIFKGENYTVPTEHF